MLQIHRAKKKNVWATLSDTAWKAWQLEGNATISLAPSAFAHRLQLIYFERTDRTTAEGTFILDRAVCLLDIVDGERSSDVPSLWQRGFSVLPLLAQENVRTEAKASFFSARIRLCKIRLKLLWQLKQSRATNCSQADLRSLHFCDMTFKRKCNLTLV